MPPHTAGRMNFYSPARTPLARRIGIVALTVLAWMGCGWALALDANAYLLLGIPITFAFQRFVARAPASRLWVFDAELPLRPRLRSWAWAGVPALMLPAFSTAYSAASGAPIAISLWFLASAVGLVIAMALGSAGRIGTRAGWQIAALAVVVGCLVFVATFLATPSHGPGHGVVAFLSDAVMYFGVMFLVEEVAFRGAFDPFVARLATGTRAQWVSAAAISFLWGLWHFPIVFATPMDAISWTGAQVLIFHTCVGCVLSFSARAAGSLMPTAAAHAIIDAVRNALA